MYPFVYWYAAIFGLIFGSFANVLILRVPTGESLSGRSHCPHCGYQLTMNDLVPVVSYLLLRGRCRKCRAPISIQYPLVEIAMGILFVLALYAAQGQMLLTLGFALSFFAMLLIVVVDYKSQLIPDSFTLLLLVGAIIVRVAEQSWSWLAVLIGGGFLGAQWLVSRGRWVGSGDVLLAAALGVLVGTWQNMLLTLWLTYIVGALVAIILLATKKADQARTIAFGPFLILGAFIAVVWGNYLLPAVLP